MIKFHNTHPLVPMTDIILSAETPLVGSVKTFSSFIHQQPQDHVIKAVGIADNNCYFVHPHLLRPNFDLDANLDVHVRVCLVAGVVEITEWDPLSNKPIENGGVVKGPPVIIDYVPLATVIAMAKAVAEQHRRCAKKNCLQSVDVCRSVLVKEPKGAMKVWCSCCHRTSGHTVTTVFNGRNLLPHAPVTIEPMVGGGIDSQILIGSLPNEPQIPVENILTLVRDLHEWKRCSTNSCSNRLVVQTAGLLATEGGGTELFCAQCFDSLVRNPNTAEGRVILDGRRLVMGATVPIIGQQT